MKDNSNKQMEPVRILESAEDMEYLASLYKEYWGVLRCSAVVGS